MIDIDNYKRAIVWLRRDLTAVMDDHANSTKKLCVLHAFEVTYNISEALLREVYATVNDDKEAVLLSTRELIRRAGEEGLVLSAPKQWLQYGILIDDLNEACMSLRDDIDLPVGLLHRFAAELKAFADSLEVRGSALA